MHIKATTTLPLLLLLTFSLASCINFSDDKPGVVSKHNKTDNRARQLKYYLDKSDKQQLTQYLTTNHAQGTSILPLIQELKTIGAVVTKKLVTQYDLEKRWADYLLRTYVEQNADGSYPVYDIYN